MLHDEPSRVVFESLHAAVRIRDATWPTGRTYVIWDTLPQSVLPRKWQSKRVELLICQS